MSLRSPRSWIIALAAIGLGLTSQKAEGAFFSGTGTGSESGNPIAASADFSYSGGVLTITLTNTSTFNYSDPPNSSRAVPSDVLTGLFFDYNSGGPGPSATPPSLTFNTATTPTITVGTNPSNLKLSSTPGGWDYAQGSLSGVTQHYGLGTAGFGIFDGGTSSGGVGNPTNFGVMNSLFVDGEGNPSVDGTPYAKDSITFKLTVSGTFNPDLINHVRFQYGTQLNEGHIDGGGGTPTGNLFGAPAPAGLILLASGVPVLAFRRVFRRKPVAA